MTVLQRGLEVIDPLVSWLLSGLFHHNDKPVCFPEHSQKAEHRYLMRASNVGFNCQYDIQVLFFFIKIKLWIVFVNMLKQNVCEMSRVHCIALKVTFLWAVLMWHRKFAGHGSIGLLHSPSLVAVGLPIGYETWPPIGWHHPFVIGWSKYRLDLPHVIVGSCDQQWKFPPSCRGHW